MKAQLVARLLQPTMKGKNIDPLYWNYPELDTKIDNLGEKTLASLLMLLGVPNCAGGTIEDLKTTFFSLRETITATEEEKKYLLFYSFFKNFSLPTVMFHKAVRSADFDQYLCAKKV